jgi:urocanate hydratase
MAGASCFAVERQARRIQMRLRTGYVDLEPKDLDGALAIVARSGAERKLVSMGVLGNAAEIFPELVRRGVRPDILVDVHPELRLDG